VHGKAVAVGVDLEDALSAVDFDGEGCGVARG